jgi:hypothetical protein
MTDAPKQNGLLTRVKVLEEKVRLISIVLKWLVGGIITTLVAVLIKW